MKETALGERVTPPLNRLCNFGMMAQVLLMGI
jgi:hypothetical protein